MSNNKCKLSSGEHRKLMSAYERKKKDSEERNIGFELSFDEFSKLIELSQSNNIRCFYTGSTFSHKEDSPFYPTMERLCDRRPYRIDNIVWVTKASNQLKDTVFDKKLTPFASLSTKQANMVKKIKRNFNDKEKRESQRDYIIRYCSVDSPLTEKFEINFELSYDEGASRGIVVEALIPSCSPDVDLARKYLAFHEDNKRNFFDIDFYEFAHLIKNAKCPIRDAEIALDDAVILLKDPSSPVTLGNCTVISKAAKDKIASLIHESGLKQYLALLAEPAQYQPLVETTAKTAVADSGQSASSVSVASNVDKLIDRLDSLRSSGVKLFNSKDSVFIYNERSPLHGQALLFKKYYLDGDKLMASMYHQDDKGTAVTSPLTFIHPINSDLYDKIKKPPVTVADDKIPHDDANQTHPTTPERVKSGAVVVQLETALEPKKHISSGPFKEDDIVFVCNRKSKSHGTICKFLKYYDNNNIPHVSASKIDDDKYITGNVAHFHPYTEDLYNKMITGKKTPQKAS